MVCNCYNLSKYLLAYIKYLKDILPSPSPVAEASVLLCPCPPPDILEYTGAPQGTAAQGTMRFFTLNRG